MKSGGVKDDQSINRKTTQNKEIIENSEFPPNFISASPKCAMNLWIQNELKKLKLKKPPTHTNSVENSTKQAALNMK